MKFHAVLGATGRAGFVAAAWLLAVAGARGQGLMVDKIAGQVNGRIITFSEVLSLSRPAEADLRRRYEGAELEEKILEVRRDALNQLIERALIVWDFEQQEELQLPEKVVDDEMRRVIEEMHGGDRNAFRERMTADGFTMEEVRKQIRERIIVQLMRQRMVTAEIFVSPRKIERFYEENREEFRQGAGVKVVLVQGPETNPGAADVPAVLGQVRERVANGATVANAVDAVAAERGMQLRVQDLGWLERGDLRPELDPVAFELEGGHSAEPVKTDDGWFLVFVEDRRPDEILPLDDVRHDIEGRLEIEERNRRQQEWIDSLRKRSYVRVNLR